MLYHIGLHSPYLLQVNNCGSYSNLQFFRRHHGLDFQHLESEALNQADYQLF